MNSEKQSHQDLDDNQFPPRVKRRNSPINLTGMGARIAVTAMVIGLGVLIISYIMRSPTEEALTDAPNETPTSVQLSIEPTSTIEMPQQLATVTAEPTSTPPPPEPTLAPVIEPPAVLTIGKTAQVSGTGTDGVNMRQSGGVNFRIIETLGEGTVFELIGGPSDADGHTWWQVRLDNGTEGWVVQDFITPN